jgi:hypothetical protein
MFDESPINGATRGGSGFIKPPGHARVHSLPSPPRGCIRAQEDAMIERHPEKPLPAKLPLRVRCRELLMLS